MNPEPTAAPSKSQGQATFSAIGDVQVAMDDAVHEAETARSRMSWAGIAAYTVLAYLAGLAALLSLDAPPRAGDLLRVPLTAAFICFAAAWSRARWKARARNTRAELKSAQKAADSLAHESACGLDAIRAHMIALRTDRPDCASSEHFSRLNQGANRICSALRHFNRT
ncbi:MAG: hypothetical protein LLG20_05025 [Acidobacteriales bacterium]|nr:hypothetical protein [Terriglobales bacterium]